MSLLLDSHVLIWLNYAKNRVPQRVVKRVAEADAVFVSVVSGWELGIKRLRRPDTLPLSFDTLVSETGFSPLGLEFACHSYSETLPPIHADPFDRMLVAQALHHGLTLVTNDRAIRRYPVETLW